MGNYDHLKLDNQLCFPLYAASREVIKKYRPYLDEIDLTYTQYVAMMVLWEHGRCSVKELGERLYLDSGTLSPLLKGLEAKGFITRTRSEEDERTVMVEPTLYGGEILREKASPIPAAVGGCVELSPEEAAELYRLLYKLLGKEI